MGTQVETTEAEGAADITMEDKWSLLYFLSSIKNKYWIRKKYILQSFK